MIARHLVIPVYLLLCILLGGASAAGFLANLVLQLLAIPIILVALVARRQAPMGSGARGLLILLGLLLLLLILQLVPLPPDLWPLLPGRDRIAEGFASLGVDRPWLPISLSPHDTIASALWLLPAVAVVLGILRLGGFRPSWIAFSIIAATLVSVLIGAIQVAGGVSSSAYFYQITNRGFAVGTFANNNHMATLLLIAIPFLFAMMGGAAKRRSSAKGSSGLVIGCSALLVVVAVGLAINTSLAGIGLALPVTAASLLLLRSPSKPLPKWSLPAIALIIAAAVTVVLLAPLGNNLVGAEARTSSDSRYTSISTTLDAAVDHLPFGSGVGTFVEIYRTHEDPLAVTRTYMNHAHSDLAEIVLEAGIPAVVLLVLFILWWLSRASNLWRAGDSVDLFARAATIASAAVVMHSAVDYPLRTAAISALFAACLALMTQPRSKQKARRSREVEARHLSAD